MRAESPRAVICMREKIDKRAENLNRTWCPQPIQNLRGQLFSGETASLTFWTCSLISPTCGCTSLIKSCSACESFSIRLVISCSSSNIASWRDEMRCIHQKQAHQQPTPNQVRTKRVMSLCPDCFDLDVNGDCLAN